MYLQELVQDLDGEPGFDQVAVRDRNRVVRTDRVRLIQRPNKALMQLQRRLLVELRGLGLDLPYATASMPGSSLKGNVLPHRDDRYFYLLDLEGAYGSVTVERLAKILGFADPRLDGLEGGVRTFLSRYCLSERGLLMGGPASQDLFNIYAALLIDDPISELVTANGWVYTRYLDDLTISSREPITGQDRRNVRSIVTRAGFAVSHHKSRVLDLAKGPIVITGIGLEMGGRIFAPRHYLRHLRGLLNLAQQGRISAEVMAAKMGAFWAMTERPLNETEWRLVRSYWKYRDATRFARRASA